MNKKGFTLIELLAVIVVIALIIIIVAPNVTKVISGSKKDSQKVQLSTVEDALKTYITQNALALGDTDSVCISDLKETGLLEDKTIYNTDTKEEITGCYNITWNSEYNQYDYEYNKDAVKVTFNANGGVVNIPSKTVTIGQTYGDLPTPTREGYTFKGWNGKNKITFNNMDSTVKGVNLKITNNNMTMSGTGTGTGLIANPLLDLTLNSGVYTISIQGTGNTSVGFLQGWDITNGPIKDSDTPFFSPQIRLNGKKTFTIENTKKLRLRIIVYKNYQYNNIFNIQLEEGSFATPYEPYYVTSLTNVTQAKNHTLTAIWEQNT